jgi:hypothetical protein
MTSIRLLAMSAFLFAAMAGAAQAQTADIQTLHDALHLTPTQDPAWKAFQAATLPDPNQAARRRAAADMIPTLTAPRRVDLTIAEMQADLQTLKQRGAALKVFYAILTPAQQAVFDVKTGPRGEEGE